MNKIKISLAILFAIFYVGSANATQLVSKLILKPDEKSYYSKFTVTGKVLVGDFEVCTLMPTQLQTKTDVEVTVIAKCENSPATTEIKATRKQADNSRNPKADWLVTTVWVNGKVSVFGNQKQLIGSTDNVSLYTKIIR